MPLYAATATADLAAHGWLILALIAAFLVSLYVLECWLWPFAGCRRCGGSGKRLSPDGRRFGLCRRCKGTARRLRFGRWVYNRARRWSR